MKAWIPRPLAIVAAGLILFLYLPIIIVVIYAFNSGGNLSWPPEGFSFRWFDAMFAEEAFRAAFEMSMKVALITTAIASLIGGMAALALTRDAWWLAKLVDTVARLPIMVPPLLIGIALLTTIAAAGLELSLLTIVAGHLIYVIPYVLVVVVARLQNFDLQLERAARDLGAGPFEVIRRITLPIIAPAVLGAALLAFGLSFDEIYITNFTAGAEPTLPLFVLSKLRRTVDPSINAVATVNLIIPWIALGLSALVMGKSLRRLRANRRADPDTTPAS
jgi:ABC-type spermidine/putrescine transport system permease subunit II